jgi:leucyl-tRNA synthetase
MNKRSTDNEKESPDYEPSIIEQKWKAKWYENNLYKAEDFSEKPKKYILAELPYPSGKSLHIGHALRYTVPEVYSRYLRMCGYNVLFPMGWDSFGLPTEGYALKTGKTPQEVTQELTASYKEAMQGMGYGIDWDREFATSNPDYYKWTQWLFLKFYEHGLAELKEMPVWWCEELGNLADEEVLTDENGNKISERGSHPVKKKLFKQWVLKIPEYAEKLLEGLDETDFPDHIKTAQINWIGKTEGCNAKFPLKTTVGDVSDIEVYTTRPDTIYGVTFLALAAEHPYTKALIEAAENTDELVEYVNKAKNLSDLEKQTLKEKTGLRLEGVFASHPFEDVKRDIPVYIGNYVLMETGTGAVMGVPAHDERDFDFATKYGLDVLPVIKPQEGEAQAKEAYVEKGVLVNSGRFDGLSSDQAIPQIIEYITKLGMGHKATNYRIRDWVFSRQHYWGEPIPVVYKEDGTAEPLVSTDNDEEVHAKLPLELPESMEYSPTDEGEPPLSREERWVNTVDSEGNPAKRETQTMPTWAGSSWYYLRYIDPRNDEEFCSKDKLDYWLPVDRYFGGAEHTTVHLLYSRFWHNFFHDIGLVPTKEPYQWRMNGGLLLAEDGRKMSKRYGNVVEPQYLVDSYGADATRMALCFLGPYTDTYPWNSSTIKATWKLLNTIYSLKGRVCPGVKDPALEKLFHRTIKNVTEMLEDLKANTVVSQIMILVNELKNKQEIDEGLWKDFIKLIAPLAPFIAEELWQDINELDQWAPESSVHLQPWPKYDEGLARRDSFRIGVQVDGKIRGEVEVERGDSEEDVRKRVLAMEDINAYVENKIISRFIYIPNKIVSIVTK